jgi:uncharacterized damage-inducible protein DinB
MRTRAELAISLLDNAHGMLVGNLRGLKLEEALSPAGGYRSVLGILKHVAGWSHVYRSYAFDDQRRHWAQQPWPRGLRDTVDTTQDYVDEIVAWYQQSHSAWKASLAPLPDEEFDAPHRAHWGATMPLFDIVAIMANHTSYHTGELNEILSIVRGEAWEYTEEVEENHISTKGHRLRPGWMTTDQAAAFEAHIAKRDEELHGP